MNKHSKTELHETLEKYRGTFCQISLLYFTAVFIGLGLVTATQATLGDFTLAVDIIFLIAISMVFVYIVYNLQAPVSEITRLIKTELKDIIEQTMPEEDDSEKEEK